LPVIFILEVSRNPTRDVNIEGEPTTCVRGVCSLLPVAQIALVGAHFFGALESLE
jgi:hypothetical protein